MAIRFWKKKEEVFNLENDLEAINDFIDELDRNGEELKRNFHELSKIKEEGQQLTDENAKEENMHEQIEAFDRLLESFEYFTQDTNINAIRIKKLTGFYKQQAKSHGFFAWTEKMKKEPRWYFNW